MPRALKGSSTVSSAIGSEPSPDTTINCIGVRNGSVSGPPSVTLWPIPSNKCAISRTHSTTWPSTAALDAVVNPILNLRSVGLAASANLPPASAQYASPGRWPALASSPAAASATVRAIAPSVERPAQCSPKIGPGDMRPRDGLNPTVPQQLEGIRTEPPPSDPWAKAHRPAATAAAAPPLEPPAE